MPSAKKKARREKEFMSNGAEPEVGVNRGANEVFSGSCSSRSANCLHCTVCQNNYDSRTEWLFHLGTPEHQKLARLECFRTWGEDNDMRECVVAVFCSFPLTYPGSVEKLLERFSSSGVDFLVTDFVWWPERPRVGFLQFESRVKVADIFKTLKNGSNGYVQDKLVQLKKAVDILNLEWKELLPFYPHFSTPAPSIPPTTIPIPSSSLIPEPKTPLQRQFNSICQSIEIPETELNNSLEIVNSLKQILQKVHPSGKVCMIRNYYLGLQNPCSSNSKILILNAYIADNPSDPERFDVISSEEEVKSIFSVPELQQYLPGFRMITQENPGSIAGIAYQHSITGFRFNILTFPALVAAESRLSLLVQYLCTFDPRVKPILCLVFFWAKSHRVRLSEEYVSIGNCHCVSPETAALEWMVILVLIREGILPSVRELMNRPHKPFRVAKTGNDIGFCTDLKFVQEWRKSSTLTVPNDTDDEFLISVVNLVQKFFQFYSENLDKGCWLLNPKDGEIIKREGMRCHKSHLTREETEGLNVVQTSEATRSQLKIDRFRIFILHPLKITWKLSFCVDTWTESTCSKMKSTAEALGKYLMGLRDGSSLESVLGGGHHASEGVGIRGAKTAGTRRSRKE